MKSKLPKAPIYRQVTKQGQHQEKRGVVKPKKQVKVNKKNTKPKNKFTKPIIVSILATIFLTLFIPPLLFIYHLKKIQTSFDSGNYIKSIQHAKNTLTYQFTEKWLGEWKIGTLYNESDNEVNA